MGIQVNVGLSRKASEDFQSAGVSINLTAELDGSLLTRPDELQNKIAKLYQMARDAVERQMVLTTPVPAPRRPAPAPPSRPNGHNGRPNGYHHGDRGNGNGAPRPMTPKQRSAILTIARQEGVDAFATARQTFGCDLNELTSAQASSLIDNLKSVPAAR